MSQLSDAADSPGFLLWHLTMRWQRQITATLAPLELTHVQFVLLACTYWLNLQGETPHQIAVASMAGTDTTMTSQIVRKLAERGLVIRQADPRDGRAKILGVTERGSDLAKRAIGMVEAADREFFAEWPPALADALRAGPLPAAAEA